MSNIELIKAVQSYVGKQEGASDVYPTNIEGLMAICSRRPTTLEATIYEPVFCLILQGRKETWLGGRSVNFGEGESLIVSHHLPVVSRIVEATADAPYLALVLRVDMTIIRSLYSELGEVEFGLTNAFSLDAGLTDEDLLLAMTRLFGLLEKHGEVTVMAPLILREIHYRLIQANHGGMLRQLLLLESSASQIAKAINRIRQNFKSSISIPDLARTAGMSASTFHEHFKNVTATSPLQYQKNLRLIEARRLLSEGQRSVSSVAFDVGYESPTQFSREYSRKFGSTPRNDLLGTQMTG